MVSGKPMVHGIPMAYKMKRNHTFATYQFQYALGILKTF